MFGPFRRLYDPFKTIKHVSYREMRARYKKQQAWADRYTKIIFTLMMIGIVIVIVAGSRMPVVP